MDLLRLCYDENALIFKKCIFSAKRRPNPLTDVRFCDTLVIQELRM